MTAPAASDSLASVAIELGKLLEPLRTELVAPNTKGFFAQLGIPLTDAQATAMGTELGVVADSTDALLTLIPQIIAAITAENWSSVTEKAIQATIKVGEAISALDDLETTARGLTVPNAADLAKHIFDFLLARYLDAAHGLNDLLEFIGLLDREDVEPLPADPSTPPYTLYSYEFDAIGEWLSDPAAKAVSLYGWDAGFDGQKLFPRLEKLIALSGLPVFYDDTATPKRLDMVIVELVPTTSGVAGLAIRLKDDFATGTIDIPLGTDATLEVNAEVHLPLQTELVIRTDGSVTFTPPSVTSLSGALDVKLIVRRGSPFVVFGQAGGSRLEFGELVLGANTQLQMDGGAAHGQLDVSGTLTDGKVIIDGRKGDGFIGKILPGTYIEADFSLLMGVSTERGFYFSGSSALEVRLPTHIQLGPISIEALTLMAALDGGNVPMSVGADIRAKLGPIDAVVQNMGVTATLSFPPNNTGNLGPAQLDIGFKPPNGVGLRVAAGPISGGGFLSLDYVKGEYIGALELSFKGVFSLKAVGIINTKLPDGSKGFALLILVTAEFSPINVGFGFTLMGVGGLLGLNRTLDSAALRLGVRTGGVSSVLFPPDVIGNIVKIVSDLKAFFPIAQGHFVVAPMVKIGWAGSLISLELGIILDIPAPQLTIIGVLRLVLPNVDAPILKLQVNFAGGVDFEQGLIWFDASLFDSSLLVFTLSGDMALRIGWGARSLFVISVGGFHPAFHEVPSDLTGMKRIGIALLSGENPRIMAQTYFAVTSNTVQSGAKVELYAAAAGFNIYGFLGYDILIQFSPFHLVAKLYAGLALRNGTDVIAGIDVSAELSGPTPWHVKGDASFKVLFFSISIGFDETWGSPPPVQIVETVDVLALVKAAVEDARNWRAELPTNTSQGISLRKTDPLPAGALLLHPFGVLSVSQKIAPLDLPIDKYGTQRPVGDTTFSITWTGGAADVAREEFAIANYVAMSDSEKLSRKSFEQMKSGLRFSTGDSAATGGSAALDVTYEMSYVHHRQATPAGRVGLPKSMFDRLSRGGAVVRNANSVSVRKRGGNGPASVEVDTGDYVVVNVKDLSPVAAHAAARTQAEALAMRDALERDDPSLAGTIQVMAAHELTMAGAA